MRPSLFALALLLSAACAPSRTVTVTHVHEVTTVDRWAHVDAAAPRALPPGLAYPPPGRALGRPRPAPPPPVTTVAQETVVVVEGDETHVHVQQTRPLPRRSILAQRPAPNQRAASNQRPALDERSGQRAPHARHDQAERRDQGASGERAKKAGKRTGKPGGGVKAPPPGHAKRDRDAKDRKATPHDPPKHRDRDAKRDAPKRHDGDAHGDRGAERDRPKRDENAHRDHDAKDRKAKGGKTKPRERTAKPHGGTKKPRETAKPHDRVAKPKAPRTKAGKASDAKRRELAKRRGPDAQRRHARRD